MTEQLPTLTAHEQALVRTVAVAANVPLATVFAYLHWARGRGEMLDGWLSGQLPLVLDEERKEAICSA